MSERKSIHDPATVRAMWLVRTEAISARRVRSPIPQTNAEAGGVAMFVSYGPDDYVAPTDLPRSFVCRVTQAHAVPGTSLQVLELDPLEGPWPRGTHLIRGSDSVRPVTSTELWELRTAKARPPLVHGPRPPRRLATSRRATRLDEVPGDA